VPTGSRGGRTNRPGADDVLGPSRMKHEEFHAGVTAAMGRLPGWLLGALWMALGTLADIVIRRDSTQRRADRLRRIFEALGATSVKIGQQLAARVDLLPYEYSIELDRMLDQVPPLPLHEARRLIEAAAGRPLAEAFLEIEPTPISSAPVACVYRATLHDDTKVAIKVRRPGIREKLAAHLRALGWLLWGAEIFFLHPGFTSGFLSELRFMLVEDLDFTREARFAELFRLESQRHEPRYATAPRVHFELSNEDVIVSDLVSGVWLTELLRAVEARDRPSLARYAAMGIRPGRVARRLLRNIWLQNQENWLFHADLHPTNIAVCPGGMITFVDFGSCGSFTEKDRRAWRQLLLAQSHDDVGGMVQASLALLEPFPPIDVAEFGRRLEVGFWSDFFAHKSDHAEGWERTGVSLWVGFLKLAQDFEVPVSRNTLRMIRATMLSDTLCARLYPDIDRYREYRKLMAASADRVSRRVQKKVRGVLSNLGWRRQEALFDLGTAALYRAQRFMDGTSILYGKMQDTTYYALGQIARAVLTLAVLTGSAGVIVAGYRAATARGARSARQILGEQLFTLAGWRGIVLSGWWVFLVVVVSLTVARRIVIRFDQKEV
jgi:ubiquinone biosynthesis protein